MTALFRNRFSLRLLLSLPLSSLLLLLNGIGISPALGQEEWQNPEQSCLEEVMPQAQSFSDKQGDPPVIQAFRQAGGERSLAGYLFTTPDVPPEEIATADLLISL